MNDLNLRIHRFIPPRLYGPALRALTAYRKTDDIIYAGPLREVVNGELQLISKHPDTHPYRAIVDRVNITQHHSHNIKKKEATSRPNRSNDVQSRDAALSTRQIAKQERAFIEEIFLKVEDHTLAKPAQNDLIMIAHEWGMQLFRAHMLIAHANLSLQKEQLRFLAKSKQSQTEAHKKKCFQATPKITTATEKTIIIGGALFIAVDLLVAIALLLVLCQN